MIQKLGNLFKSDLIKVSSKTGIATFIKLAAGFIVSKILAIFVGPSGLAYLGQLSNFGNIFQALSSGGIGIGVTKYIAEYHEDEKTQLQIISNSIKVTLICSLVCTAIVSLCYKYLGTYLFKTDIYNSIVLVFGLTLILFSFNSLISTIINGFKNFKLYVVINLTTSIISLFSTVIFVYYLGVYGALLSFVLIPSMVFFISLWMVRKYGWFNIKILKIPFDKSILKKLGAFSLMAINNAVVGAIAQLAIRSLISKNMDMNTAGIWDGMNRLSAAYLLLITTSIQVYYLPTLSAIKEKKLLWKEIIKTEKIIIPITIFMFLIIFLFRGIIIEILFTKEFYLMKSVFAYQLLGDLIKIGAWIISYTMYAKAMTKQLILSDTIFTFIYVLTSYIMMNLFGYGLNSVYYAFILNNVLYFMFIYFFMKKYISDVRPQT